MYQIYGFEKFISIHNFVTLPLYARACMCAGTQTTVVHRPKANMCEHAMIYPILIFQYRASICRKLLRL